jgi:hypothetical protein
MQAKYADVLPLEEVLPFIEAQKKY